MYILIEQDWSFLRFCLCGQHELQRFCNSFSLSPYLSEYINNRLANPPLVHAWFFSTQISVLVYRVPTIIRHCTTLRGIQKYYGMNHVVLPEITNKARSHCGIGARGGDDMLRELRLIKLRALKQHAMEVGVDDDVLAEMDNV